MNKMRKANYYHGCQVKGTGAKSATRRVMRRRHAKICRRFDKAAAQSEE